MYYVGLDIHSKRIAICILGETGQRSWFRRGFCQDRERDSGCIPGSDMAQCDAAGVNGSNRIRSHGAPLLRMMPNGCLGSPVLVLLFGLDRGFLMDVGPEQVTEDMIVPFQHSSQLLHARQVLHCES